MPQNPDSLNEVTQDVPRPSAKRIATGTDATDIHYLAIDTVTVRPVWRDYKGRTLSGMSFEDVHGARIEQLYDSTDPGQKFYKSNFPTTAMSAEEAIQSIAKLGTVIDKTHDFILYEFKPDAMSARNPINPIEAAKNKGRTDR